MTRVTKTTMPQRGGRSSYKSVRRGKLQRVQGAGAIAPEDHLLRRQILHRSTSGVKFNRAIVIRGELEIVIRGELAYGNKVINKSRRNKDIIKRDARE